jgi:hypothetical protein
MAGQFWPRITRLVISSCGQGGMGWGGGMDVSVRSPLHDPARIIHEYLPFRAKETGKISVRGYPVSRSIF